MGLPVIAIPIAALFVDIETAVVVIAFPNVLANAFLGVPANAHCVHETRDLPVLAVAGVIGAVAGTLLFVSVPETPLIIAVIVAIVGYVALFFAPSRPAHRTRTVEAARAGGRRRGRRVPGSDRHLRTDRRFVDPQLSAPTQRPHPLGHHAVHAHRVHAARRADRSTASSPAGCRRRCSPASRCSARSRSAPACATGCRCAGSTWRSSACSSVSAVALAIETFV